MNESSERLQMRKIVRGKYLNALYDAADGNSRSRVRDCDVWASLNIEEMQMDAIVHYLEQEGLLEYAALGGIISITHQGVVEVEQSREEPDEPTEHFPAQNIIFGDVINSQISQGSPGSNQVGTFEFANPEIDELITSLQAKAQHLGLGNRDLQELRSDLGASKSQRESSQPKSSIVKESLASIRRILEGATARIIADPLLAAVTSLIHSFGFSH